MSLGTFCIFTFLLKGLVMKKFCVTMIAACVLAMNTANTAEASLLSKRIDAVKKIAIFVGNTFKKTADDAAKTVWNNKGAIAVGTVATVALTNPEAATAAVSGTADVAYGVVIGGKTADTVVPRANVRPATTGMSIMPTLLFFLAFVGIGIVIATYFRRRTGVFRIAVPLLMVGIVLFCGVGVAEAGVVSIIPKPPVLPPITAGGN
jgi:uncharacterized membrane protein YgdD (TMEM256/DUF423 family)